MISQYKTIFLNGFRGSGKSTIGKKLAEKLDWEYIEMDEIISKRAGMNIYQLTKGGIDWQQFRQMEHKLLEELIDKKNVVVSTGGGVGVNTVVKQATTATFGKLNSQLMKQTKNALLVALLTSEAILTERMRSDEMQKAEILRPILNEKTAKDISEKVKQFSKDPNKQKEIIVDALIQTEMELYKIRKPLYENLSNYVFDTGKLSVDQVVNKIMNLVTAN